MCQPKANKWLLQQHNIQYVAYKKFCLGNMQKFNHNQTSLGDGGSAKGPTESCPQMDKM